MGKTIIHVVSLAAIGGVQTSFMSFMFKALQKSQFRHKIISQHDFNPFFDSIKKYHMNIRGSLLNKLKLVYYLMSNKYIVHFHNNFGSKAIYRLLRIIPSSNIIFHEYGTAWNAKKEDKFIYTQNQDKSDVVIACSKASKTILTKQFDLKEDKIKVIYHTGLIQKLSNLSLSDRYSPVFSVGFIGRFDTPKGIHVFIESAKQLNEFNFYLAGGGVLEEMLKKQAEDYTNIFFVGVINPLEFMSKIDILVVPSLREPLGNIVIEAGVSKKAVIAANVDGIPEIITNNKNGILINPTKQLNLTDLPEKAVPIPKIVVNPSNQEIIQPKQLDVDELSRKITDLAQQEEFRNSLGEELYKTVNEKFTIDIYFEQLEDIYNTFK